ncbi:MAG: hypothetical protein ABI402_15280 [Ferruginibacter sp.]
MKTGERILVEFIKDFNLEMPDVGICFTADIEFITASLFKKFNCEVHIVTVTEKQLTFIYLLHLQLAENGIPDIFPFHADNFCYNKMKDLSISDYDLLRGKYTITISPLKTALNKSEIKSLNLI